MFLFVVIVWPPWFQKIVMNVSGVQISNFSSVGMIVMFGYLIERKGFSSISSSVFILYTACVVYWC